MRPIRQTEQLVRSVILLLASAMFSLVAYFTGAFDLTDQRWTYACIVAVVAAAAVVSRLGGKWVMQRLAQQRNSASGEQS